MDSGRPRVDARDVPGEEYLVVGGRELRLTHPDRVLYPATGTTKSDVIAYYAAVAGAICRTWPGGRRPASGGRTG
jgi:DNA primase